MTREDHAENFREAVRLKMFIGEKIYIQETKEHGTIHAVMIVESVAIVYYKIEGKDEIKRFPLDAVTTGPEGINFLIDHSEGAFVMDRAAF